MLSMKRSACACLLALCALVFVLPLAAQDFAAQKEARRELSDMGMSFSVRSFEEVIKRGDILALELYLKGGMSPNERINARMTRGSIFYLRGSTALHVAVEYKQPAVVQFLLEHGANVNSWGYDLSTGSGSVTGTALYYANIMKFISKRSDGAVVKIISILRKFEARCKGQQESDTYCQ